MRLLLALLFPVLVPSLQARIIQVPGDSEKIQGGINGAAKGDTVMVAQGTYYEHNIDFLGKAITVMGTDPEDSAVVAATVVDGGSLGSVFVFDDGEDLNSVLAGLTIRGGYGPTGGGIYCDLSSPTITNNMIIENHAGFGGGIYFFSGSPGIADNNIRSNSADFKGGGIFGGDSSGKIAANRIAGNSAGLTGAGVFIEASTDVEITGNVISGNVSDYNGGGISFYSSSLRISENLIVGNEAQFNGGGIICDGGSPTISNNSIAGNSASSGGGISCGVLPIISNSLFWGNSPDEISGDPAVTYCDIQGGYPGEGNIDADPMFVDPDIADYSLQSESPCIDTGDPGSPNVPWGGWRRDIGACEYDQGFYRSGPAVIWKPVPGRVPLIADP